MKRRPRLSRTFVSFTALALLATWLTAPPASATDPGDVSLSQVSSPVGGSGTELYAGNTVTYTITVDNTGDPSDAENVHVQDTLDAAIVASSVKACAGTGCTLVSTPPDGTNTIDVEVGLVAAGSSATVTVEGQVKASFLPDGGHITNTISSTSDTVDPDTSNNLDQGLDTTVDTRADVALSQVSSPVGGSGTELYAGNTVTYTITVDNTAGPSDAQNVHVQDTLDASIVSSSVKACAGTGCTLATVSPDGTNTIDVTVGLVAAGSSATVTVQGKVQASFLPDGGNITNKISSTSTTEDPTSANNTNKTLGTTVNTLADVSVTQVAKNPAGDSIDATHRIFAGQVITYVATIHNDGPSDAQNVKVMDTFDSHLTNTKSCVVAGAVTCTADTDFSDYTALDLISVATLGPGAVSDRTVYFRGKIPSNVPNGTVITNEVNAQSYAGTEPATTDPSPADNTSNNTVIVSPTVNTLADVSLSQVASPPGSPGTKLYAGNTVTYTITVDNTAGPSDAQNVHVQDTLDASIVSSSVKACAGTGCLPATVTPDVNYAIDVSVGTVAAGTAATVTVEGKVKASFLPDGGHITNTISSTSTTEDPDSTNNTNKTLDSTVDTLADISVAQTRTVLNAASFTPLVSGNRHSVQYELTITNNGPSDAQSVLASDTLQADRLDVAQAKYCVGVTCAPTTSYGNGTNVSAGLTPLAPGASVVVRFQAPVLSGLRTGPRDLNNTVSASSATEDLTLTNNSNTTTLQTIFTVPGVTTLRQTLPGNQQVGLLWDRVPDAQNGGNAITGYDVIFAPVGPGSTTTFLYSGNTANASDGTNVTRIAAVVPTPGNLTNNTTYTITVKARNAAGDADTSNSLTETPCPTCAVAVVSTGGTAAVSTGSTATGTVTLISNYNLSGAPAGAVVNLHIVPSGSDPSMCFTPFEPAGTGDCISDQVIHAEYPAQQNLHLEVDQYDSSVSSQLLGAPCTAATPVKTNGVVTDLKCTSANPKGFTKQYIYYIVMKLPGMDLSEGKFGQKCTNGDPNHPNCGQPGIIGSSLIAGANLDSDPYLEVPPQCQGKFPFKQTPCVFKFNLLNKSNGTTGNNDIQDQIYIKADGSRSSTG
jgi:uncharacterized repeat protein (TIGR01451 family)